jgi:hypothetical protein
MTDHASHLGVLVEAWRMTKSAASARLMEWLRVPKERAVYSLG